MLGEAEGILPWELSWQSLLHVGSRERPCCFRRGLPRPALQHSQSQGSTTCLSPLWWQPNLTAKQHSQVLAGVKLGTSHSSGSICCLNNGLCAYEWLPGSNMDNCISVVRNAICNYCYGWLLSVWILQDKALLQQPHKKTPMARSKINQHVYESS